MVLNKIREKIVLILNCIVMKYSSLNLHLAFTAILDELVVFYFNQAVQKML